MTETCMTDLNVFRRKRNHADGACPTGVHQSCDITVVSPQTFRGAIFIIDQFHFDDDENAVLEFICIDTEMALVILDAHKGGLTVSGAPLLSELAGASQRAVKTKLLCACGNNPSPADGFCKSCRPRKQTGSAPRRPKPNANSPRRRNPARGTPRRAQGEIRRRSS